MSPVHQVWPYYLARYSEMGKKTRQAEEEVGRQHQGMDGPGVRQVPEGSGERETEGNWLQNYLWCPDDPRGQGIDDDDDDVQQTLTALLPPSHMRLLQYGRTIPAVRF